MATGTEITRVADTKKLNSIMCSAIDKPVRGFQWIELVGKLRTTRESETTNNPQVYDIGHSDQKISHVNQIQIFLSFLTLLLLKIKIDLTSKFDMKYIHLLNCNYVNYSYIYKHNCLFSYQPFSNWAYHDNFESNGNIKMQNKKHANIILDYREI